MAKTNTKKNKKILPLVLIGGAVAVGTLVLLAKKSSAGGVGSCTPMSCDLTAFSLLTPTPIDCMNPVQTRIDVINRDTVPCPNRDFYIRTQIRVNGTGAILGTSPVVSLNIAPQGRLTTPTMSTTIPSGSWTVDIYIQVSRTQSPFVVECESSLVGRSASC